MRVRVRFFAGTRDVVGAGSLDVELPARATMGDLFDRVVAAHPRLAAYRGHALLALDGRFVGEREPVRDGAEAAVMPPVSGGRGALTREPLDAAALHGELHGAGAGAVASFLGIVRGDHGVASLEFEAYPEMAETELARVRDEATAKFALLDCLVRHRVGVVPVGEPAVAVLVAARHRREAFEACAWIMDELKARVPVWKKEGERWVNDPTMGERS